MGDLSDRVRTQLASLASSPLHSRITTPPPLSLSPFIFLISSPMLSPSQVRDTPFQQKVQLDKLQTELDNRNITIRTVQRNYENLSSAYEKRATEADDAKRRLHDEEVGPDRCPSYKTMTWRAIPICHSRPEERRRTPVARG